MTVEDQALILSEQLLGKRNVADLILHPSNDREFLIGKRFVEILCVLSLPDDLRNALFHSPRETTLEAFQQAARVNRNNFIYMDQLRKNRLTHPGILQRPSRHLPDILIPDDVHTYIQPIVEKMEEKFPSARFDFHFHNFHHYQRDSITLPRTLELLLMVSSQISPNEYAFDRTHFSSKSVPVNARRDLVRAGILYPAYVPQSGFTSEGLETLSALQKLYDLILQPQFQ